MKNIIFNIILLLVVFTSTAQQHFWQFKSIVYKNIPVKMEFTSDSTVSGEIILSKKENYKIRFNQPSPDSTILLVYKAGKNIQRLVLPYPTWLIGQTAYMADINNDKRQDLKFFIYGTGTGLAAETCTKVYLFNTGNGFKLLSFFDYSSEKEYDLDNDGVYEILGRNHVYKDEHSYWVYNVFDFDGTTLVNVSKKFNYPLWTKHLIKTDKTVANNINYDERIKEYRPVPDSMFVR